MSKTTSAARTWNAYQLAIFRDAAEGYGHTVVQARAGTGKTTTIVEMLGHFERGLTVLMVAFNKSIATELQARAPEGVEVKTLHAHGFSAIRRAFRNVRVEDRKSVLIAERLWGKEKGVSYAAVKHLVTVAKDTLVAHDDLDGLDAIIDAFQVDAPDGAAEREDFVRRASRVLEESKRETSMIDFSDMCWLPVVLDLRVWQFDRVVVDETQDLCPSQIELVLKCVRRGGRVTAVGDDRQAIYGFRGADSAAMDKLVERLGAKVLPLSVTYRCGSRIVALAKAIVADYECPPTAHEGTVLPASYEQLATDATPGDMVISRANAPLLGLCLGFLKEGKRAAIKGRDVGEGLIKLVRKSKAETVADLEVWIGEWFTRESDRLAKKDRDATEASDKRDCILALCEGAQSIAEVVARAESLFTAVDDSNRITLGTTHKLKGLEADRVWMLADTYARGRGIEGQNLRYVAITRAKRELRMVDKVLAPGALPEA